MHKLRVIVPGVGLVDKVLKKIDVMKLKRRVAAYDKAVEHYINKFASAQPPEMAKSVQEVLGKKPDNPFCSDILFETRDAAWANDRTCQLGQNYLLLIYS